MMNEVSTLLDIMEDIIDSQRARRLEKLKPPSWYQQNWYLIAIACPSIAYLSYMYYKKSPTLFELGKYTTGIIFEFTKEHVIKPCFALYDEFMKGPSSISDRAARDTATETLKKMMIRSW
mmetsp:Transcript_34933/g.39227  ORF Transcript_34933/g.39227 Transcript_34933/m.39227 type:complete len:120 (+) Transcript_34933:267-626(+)